MPKKNPHAVALGRAGGRARWLKLTAAERSALGRRLVEARKARPVKQEATP